MIRNRASEIADGLRADWPGFDIWLVYKAVGGITWCARRADGSGRPVNAGSADGLADLLGKETR